jgi:hypothetical protein
MDWRIERKTKRRMDTPPLPEPASMPIFILFDTQTGYLYGHLFATGPEDPQKTLFFRKSSNGGASTAPIHPSE